MAVKGRRIGIFAYHDAQALDIVGPADAFAAANMVARTAIPHYEIYIFGLEKLPITTQAGIVLLPQRKLASATMLDTFIIPGGSGLRTDESLRRTVGQWIRRHAGAMRRIASVCTGIYALAESGGLDGRNATTHWRFAADVARRWPAIALQADAIFIKDGKYYTSAGITAGIDLAMALIEEDIGSEVAIAVARELVVYLKRSGGQLQYSHPLRLQSETQGQFSDLVAWLSNHLADDLSTERLAERAELSARHFSRKFKAAFGSTPAEVIETLRLDRARWLLENQWKSLAEVAAAVGYGSDDTFRRAFERRFGTVPSDYRRRFGRFESSAS